MHSPELKPCPFCGGQAYFRFGIKFLHGYSDDCDRGGLVEVNAQCRNCGAAITKFSDIDKCGTLHGRNGTCRSGAIINMGIHEAQKKAVAAWNRRAENGKETTK